MFHNFALTLLGRMFIQLGIAHWWLIGGHKKLAGRLANAFRDSSPKNGGAVHSNIRMIMRLAVVGQRICPFAKWPVRFLSWLVFSLGWHLGPKF